MTSDNTYNALAPIYDEVMFDVDYEVWANFIDDILQIHHSDPVKLLELACGTGSLALSLDELCCYKIIATDKSNAMLEVARQKASGKTYNVTFSQLDFTQIKLDETYDAAILLFDSINYLHESHQIASVLEQVYRILNPGGLFIFDFTTPKNSRLAVKTLHKEKRTPVPGVEYERSSVYNHRKKLHINEFTIKYQHQDTANPVRQVTEKHQQKIYTLSEILDIVEKSCFHILAKYSGFELKEADESSLRITMVLQCPPIQ